METTTFITLPGIYNSGPTHWQTRWEELSSDFVRFGPSDWDRPRPAAWCAALERAVLGCDAPPILVAHSLACLLVPLWAAQSAASVAGAFLVAPVEPDTPRILTDIPELAEARDFAEAPRRPLTFPALVVGSSNDHFAEGDYAARFATDLGAGFVVAGALGHINADSGLGDWPQGRHLLSAFCAGAAVAGPDWP